MNSRQVQIIHLLLKKESNEYVTINEIGKALACSEKTIRNDFKQIDAWLTKDFQAKIVRKPNIGVKIEISEEEKRKFLLLNSRVNETEIIREYDRERREKILFMLMNNKTLSLQNLSEEFYVTRQVIKQDLKEMESWLELFELKIESRQKIGITLSGNEKNKRAALLRINQFGKNEEITVFYERLFNIHEIAKAKQQLRKIEAELDKEFTKESFNNLIFHLLVTVKRIKGKKIITMSNKESEVLKNKREYAVVKQNLKELERPFVLKFPEEEILYILSHIMGAKEKNASLLKQDEISHEIHTFLTNLIEKMSQQTNIEHEKDGELFHGLSIHMKSAFERIEHGLYHKNPLLNEIKKTFPYSFATLFHITKELKETVGFLLPEDEIGYLTIHFEASKERLEKFNGENKKAIVVCSMGIGMSQLLTTKLERKFHSIDIVNCVSVDDLEEAIINDKPDFIISTIPLKEMELPLITVSPLLQKDEEEKMKKFISNLGTTEDVKFATLKKFIGNDLILFKEEMGKPEDIIKSLCKLLEEKGYVNKEYVKDSIERENLSPTTIGGEIAIPHGHPRNVLKQGVAVAVLKEPIVWKREIVSVVFMLSIKNTKDEKIKKLFEEISLLGEKVEILEKWKNVKTKDDFYNVI